MYISTVICTDTRRMLDRKRHSKAVKPLYHATVTLVFITWYYAAQPMIHGFRSCANNAQQKAITLPSSRYYNYTVAVKHC